MGQQQGGDQYGTDDGFCAIQGEIPGGADEWQQGGNDTLDRKLEQFDAPTPAAPIPRAISLVRIGTRRSRSRGSRESCLWVSLNLTVSVNQSLITLLSTQITALDFFRRKDPGKMELILMERAYGLYGARHCMEMLTPGKR